MKKGCVYILKSKIINVESMTHGKGVVSRISEKCAIYILRWRLRTRNGISLPQACSIRRKVVKSLQLSAASEQEDG